MNSPRGAGTPRRGLHTPRGRNLVATLSGLLRDRTHVSCYATERVSIVPRELPTAPAWSGLPCGAAALPPLANVSDSVSSAALCTIAISPCSHPRVRMRSLSGVTRLRRTRAFGRAWGGSGQHCLELPGRRGLTPTEPRSPCLRPATRRILPVGVVAVTGNRNFHTYGYRELYT